MNTSLVDAFTLANEWQRTLRDRYLTHFYQKYSLNGRYVFMDKSACSTVLQRELAVDTVFQSPRNGASFCIEEKIDSHSDSLNFALETDSCTVPDRYKKGWMHYAQADYLLYAFERENGLDVYLIDFPKLKEWFWKVYTRYHYYVVPDTINHTGVRLVTIAHVERNVPTYRYRCTDEGCEYVKRGAA
jgi:hypothetical protein